jgi:serine/threonine-protein kinase
MQGEAATVLGPAPVLVIAMVLHKLGRTDEARKTLASAIGSYDWRESQVRDLHGCTINLLRLEAEAVMLPISSHFWMGAIDQCTMMSGSH